VPGPHVIEVLHIVFVARHTDDGSVPLEFAERQSYGVVSQHSNILIFPHLGQYLTMQKPDLRINTYSFARQSIIDKGIKQWQ